MPAPLPRLTLALCLVAACGPAPVAHEGPDEAATEDLKPGPGFGGGFSPRSAPLGGFGGGTCRAAHTPIVFIHGNGDEAKNWDYPSRNQSVLQRFQASGYNACELFGITWLSAAENASPERNFHDAAKAKRLAGFVRDVLAYTGKTQVDVIAHSLGATVALQALDSASLWGKVRKFVGIAAAYRGLNSCVWLGPANALAPTCGSQSYLTSSTFGLFPDVNPWFANPRMGSGSAGFRWRARQHPGVRFYALGAGLYDQIACAAASQSWPGCDLSWQQEDAPNLLAQLNLGFGKQATEADYDFTDWSVLNVDGGDSGAASGTGAGHFAVKVSTSQVQVNLITSECTGEACCAGYAKPCVEARAR